MQITSLKMAQAKYNVHAYPVCAIFLFLAFNK